MFMRKALLMAGLVLAIAILSPVAAQAKKGGKVRPFKGTTSGTLVATADQANPAVLLGSGNGTYQATHIGKGSFTSSVTSVIASDLSGFSNSGDLVITAANGDKLFASLSGTGTFTPECATAQPGCVITTTFTETITGGTGRFEGASGTLTEQNTAVPIAATATTTTYRTSGRVNGTISY